MEWEVLTPSPHDALTGHLSGSKLQQGTLDRAFSTKRVVKPCNGIPREVMDQVFILQAHTTNCTSNRRYRAYTENTAFLLNSGEKPAFNKMYALKELK